MKKQSAKLFSEDLTPISSDSELDSLYQKTKYDRGYLCQAAYGLREKTKNWMEAMWTTYQPHADTQFPESFKYEFTQRAWELYLGATFLNHGFKLGSHKDKGPDFDLQDHQGYRVAWVEAIAVKQGTGADRVPDIIYNGVMSVPTEQMTLRLASALEAKFKKYCSYLDDKIVNDDEPYVIAIDRSELGHVDTLLPNILKVLFGIGDLALHMRVGGKPVENPETSWTRTPAVKKKGGEPINMLFFENPEHTGISAVIYSTDHVISSPRKPEEMGENFVIVHNPLARNPLPQGFFPFGDEFVAEDDFIKKVREAKTYSEPDPFEHLDISELPLT